MPTFCQKNVHALKKQCPHVLFSKSVHDKHATVVPMFDQKHQFCQKYTILWAPRVNMMPFSPIFLEKNNCSHAHISSKKRIFAKITLPSCPNLVKTRSFSQKNSYYIMFFLNQIGHKKSPALMPVFHKKCQSC